MLFFEHTENELHLSGCVAAPGFTRPSRKDQKVFINSRPVEAQAVYRGIRDGYGALAESGRYNPVVIFIDMPPEELDVNVHPAKREVRFKSEYIISRAVASAVSAALRRTRESEISSVDLPVTGKLPLALVMDAAEIRYQVASQVQNPLDGLFFDDTPAVPAATPETPADKTGISATPARRTPVIEEKTEVSEANPIAFRLGQSGTLVMAGKSSVLEGQNKIIIEAMNPEAGKVVLSVEDIA